MDKKTNHVGSKISVVVIGIIVSVYAILYAGLCFFLYEDIPHPALLLYGLIPIALLVGIILVVKMRIKEISDGELDEARKY